MYLYLVVALAVLLYGGAWLPYRHRQQRGAAGWWGGIDDTCGRGCVWVRNDVAC